MPRISIYRYTMTCDRMAHRIYNMGRNAPARLAHSLTLTAAGQSVYPPPGKAIRIWNDLNMLLYSRAESDARPELGGRQENQAAVCRSGQTPRRCRSVPGGAREACPRGVPERRAREACPRRAREACPRGVPERWLVLTRLRRNARARN